MICGECGALGHSSIQCGPSIGAVDFRIKMPKAMADELDQACQSEGVGRIPFARRLIIEALSFRELATTVRHQHPRHPGGLP